MPKPQGKGTNSKNSNMSQSDNIINIQLLYNSNQPTEPKLWNGTFQPISLHSLLEYFSFNSKNIKKSLCWIAKYINNKNIDINKSNDVPELKDIGEAA